MRRERGRVMFFSTALALAACGSRTGLDAPTDGAAGSADVADAARSDASTDAAVCTCRVCNGTCVNVPGCPNGLCRRGQCIPRCANDGTCPSGMTCSTSLDCDTPVQVCR